MDFVLAKAPFSPGMLGASSLCAGKGYRSWGVWAKGSKNDSSVTGSKMPGLSWVPQSETRSFHLLFPVNHRMTLSNHTLSVCTSFLSVL